MRRCYSQIVSQSDAASIQTLSGTEPRPPAQTQIGAHGRPIEPEFLEIAAPDAHLTSDEATVGGGVR